MTSSLIVQLVSIPGDVAKPNEDLAVSAGRVTVVLDGATIRTPTGCTHGVPWYTRHLGAALLSGVLHERSLINTLAYAISDVAAMHNGCDLSHPGTPSAGVGMVRVLGSSLQFLTLGDITLVLDLADELRVVTDDRVSKTAPDERREADRHPIGSPAKQAALQAMKPVELAARNQPNGYWIAAADPMAAEHALTGEVSLADVRRVALVSDGAARAVTFGLVADWRSALDMIEADGPEKLIRLIREAEAEDSQGLRWPRNKASDDATVAFIKAIRI